MNVKETPSWPARPGLAGPPAGVFRAGRALLPRLGSLPRGWAWCLPVLLASAAWLLLPASARPDLWLPGDPAFPDGPGTLNYYWRVDQLGLIGNTRARWLGWPLGTDFLVTDGFPLDALAARPFAAVLGWPTAYPVFVLAALWGLGIGAAWLAGRWWHSAAAAVAAGVALQCSGGILWELHQGRPSQIFGALFLPFAWGLAADALVRRSPARGVLAGLALACAALAYWYFAWLGGLGLAVLLVLAWLEGRPAWGALAAGLAAFLLLAGPVAAYTLFGLAQQPGVGTGSGDLLLHQGQAIVLGRLIENRQVGVEDLFGGFASLRPVALGCGLLGLWRQPRRRWLAPLSWVCLGLAIIPGLWVRLPGGLHLPTLFGLSLEVPFLSRFWWPDRGLLPLALGWSVLLGGAIALAERRWARPVALAAACAGALLAESWILLPQLPLAMTPAGPSDRARALAGGTGPVLVLPQPAGFLRTDTLALLDQVHHGRPLANWKSHPANSNVPAAYLKVAAQPGLRHLLECERAPATALRSELRIECSVLLGLDLEEVVVDLPVLEASDMPAADYLACVQRLLGLPVRFAGPYAVYAVSLPPPGDQATQPAGPSTTQTGNLPAASATSSSSAG